MSPDIPPPCRELDTSHKGSLCRIMVTTASSACSEVGLSKAEETLNHSSVRCQSWGLVQR